MPASATASIPERMIFASAAAAASHRPTPCSFRDAHPRLRPRRCGALHADGVLLGAHPEQRRFNSAALAGDGSMAFHRSARRPQPTAPAPSCGRSSSALMSDSPSASCSRSRPTFCATMAPPEQLLWTYPLWLGAALGVWKVVARARRSRAATRAAGRRSPRARSRRNRQTRAALHGLALGFASAAGEVLTHLVYAQCRLPVALSLGWVARGGRHRQAGCSWHRARRATRPSRAWAVVEAAAGASLLLLRRGLLPRSRGDRARCAFAVLSSRRSGPSLPHERGGRGRAERRWLANRRRTRSSKSEPRFVKKSAGRPGQHLSHDASRALRAERRAAARGAAWRHAWRGLAASARSTSPASSARETAFRCDRRGRAALDHLRMSRRRAVAVR